MKRRLLLGGGLGVAAGVTGCQSEPKAVAKKRATTQAGVDRPVQQKHLDLAVFDLPGAPGPALARLGKQILRLTATDATLTITVGIGPRLVSAVDPALPGATDLPRFARDRIPEECVGGDLMVQICANDLDQLVQASGAVWMALAQGPNWQQRGVQAERNLLGFLDGTENPRTPSEVAEIWLPGPGRVAGGTIAVVRRLQLDVDGFTNLSLKRQEQIVGRRKTDGRPLSGGEAIDLAAKSTDGHYLIPNTSHVRRAHRLASGSGRMLRRGYHYDNGDGDQGLMFISFQEELRTFTATQHRLDDADDLMAFATATASGTFLVLPGFSTSRPLGSTFYPR